MLVNKTLIIINISFRCIVLFFLPLKRVNEKS